MSMLGIEPGSQRWEASVLKLRQPDSYINNSFFKLQIRCSQNNEKHVSGNKATQCLSEWNHQYFMFKKIQDSMYCTFVTGVEVIPDRQTIQVREQVKLTALVYPGYADLVSEYWWTVKTPKSSGRRGGGGITRFNSTNNLSLTITQAGRWVNVNGPRCWSYW